jgi:hypothetical protein
VWLCCGAWWQLLNDKMRLYVGDDGIDMLVRPLSL